MPNRDLIEQHIQNMEEALAHNNEIATLHSQ
jgi:hypothetical protein